MTSSTPLYGQKYRVVVKYNYRRIHPYAPKIAFVVIRVTTEMFMDDAGHTYKYTEILLVDGFPSD